MLEAFCVNTRCRSRHSNIRGAVAFTAVAAVALALPFSATPAAAAAEGDVIRVAPGASIPAALLAAPVGATVLLENGTHPAAWLDLYTLKRKTDLSGVTLAGASRDGVVLGGLTVKGITGLTISTMTLVNQASSNQSVVRISDGSSDILLDSTTIKPKAQSGVDIWARTHGITVSNSTVDGTGVTGTAATNRTSRSIRVNGAPYDLASWPYDLTFVGNDLFGAGSDMIQIAGGRDITIRDNDIHDPQVNDDHNDGVQSFGSDGLNIIGNRFSGEGPNGPDNAIMLGPNYSVSTLRVSRTYIANNVVKSWSGTGLNLSGSTDTSVVNNTVPILGTATSIGSSISLSSSNPGLRIWNNILGKVFGTTTGLTQEHNCVANGASSADFARNDMGFADTTSYRLAPDSQCRDRGADSGPTTDISGQVRDSLPDLGAWEYVGTTGSTRYLSDRPWTSATGGWGPVELDLANGSQAAKDGAAQSIRGKVYSKGLGTASLSTITYPLDGMCTTFSSVVGLDDETLGRGSVAFEVWVDGIRRYTTSVLTGRSPAVPVNVDVVHGKLLQLVVTDGGDGVVNDRADWANAALRCHAPESRVLAAAKASQPVVGSSVEPAVVLGPPLVPTLPTSTFLTDVAWTSATNGWGPVELDQTNGGKNPGDGKPLTLRGVVYGKGLGVHATSRVTYELDGSVSTFSAVVGIDDAMSGAGSAVFSVLVDGVKAYDSGVRGGTDPALALEVPLLGARSLTLVVTDAGNGTASDHADWADAKLVRLVAQPPTPTSAVRFLSDMTWLSATNGYGPVELDRANGGRSAGDGKALSLRGQRYAKGLGVHASSSITYDLNGGCSSFQAVVGIDDEVSAAGSAVFSVLVDGAKVYSSEVLKGAGATEQVLVPLAGASKLTLVVSDAGDGTGYDHADWAGASVSCTP